MCDYTLYDSKQFYFLCRWQLSIGLQMACRLVRRRVRIERPMAHRNYLKYEMLWQSHRIPGIPSNPDPAPNARSVIGPN